MSPPVTAPVDMLRGPRTPALPRSQDPAEIRRTAEAFEAAFLSQMLQPIFAGLSTEAPFGGGAGEETWRSFLVEAMAQQTVRAGGIGLADQITRDMLRMQGLEDAPTAPADARQPQPRTAP